MKNKIIFIACDTSKLNEVKNIINQINIQKINIIPMVHEQAAAMAADNYSRVTNNILYNAKNTGI